MPIDEKAFHRSWEVVGWDTQNPHAETGQRRFIAAYEAAKVAEQPVGSADTHLDEKTINIFQKWYSNTVNGNGIDYGDAEDICHYFARLMKRV